MIGRSRTEKSGGRDRSKDVGMSSERNVRIISAESLRVPEEG